MDLVQLDDPKRQMMLYKGLPKYSRSAQAIRRLIAEDEVPAHDLRVRLVGLKAYIAAGGSIREDMFSEKGERYLTDRLLLEMLVGEAFEVEAAKLRARGWKWVDVHPGYSYSERNQYFCTPQKVLPNACEASPLGAGIDIRIHVQEDVRVEIMNQGAVPKAVRDRLFEKFVTHGKRGGTGLGTYSARLLTEAQNGSIECTVSDV